MTIIKPENISHGDIEMHIVISDDLAQGRRQEEMEQAVREGLIIRDYVNAEISIGKFAELMQLNYEAARDWLHSHGIATSRQFTDPELEQAEAENYRKVAEELEVPLPKKPG
jgi:predicted HTH domain antitoxin